MKIKIKEIYSDIETEVFESNSKILHWLFELPYRTEFNINRFICYLFGCKKAGGYGGFNLPDGAYSYYCKRCLAAESNYEGVSNHKFLEGIFKK